MRAHEIARELLKGPDCPAIFFAGDDGFGIIDEVKEAYIRVDAEGVAVKEYYPQPRTGLSRVVELESSIFQSGSREQTDMGLMKRVHTELHAGNGRTLSRLMPEERAGWNSLIKADEANQFAVKANAERKVAEAAPDNALESIGLELRYVGTTPTVNGDYFVVDTLTESRRFVFIGGLECVRIVRIDGRTLTSLTDFLKPSQRWFLIPRLEKDDLTLVRELPIA